MSNEYKVILLKSLLSNCTLNGENISWTYKKPFCYIAETGDFEKIYPGCDCLGFPPRSNSFAIEPAVQLCSIFSLSGLTRLCSCRPYGNPLEHELVYLIAVSSK